MQCMRKRWIPGVIAVTLYWYGALLYTHRPRNNADIFAR